VIYSFKKDPEKKRCFGFIAQEVEQSFMGENLRFHHVRTDPEGNVNQSLVYDEVISPLVKVVQNLMKEVVYRGDSAILNNSVVVQIPESTATNFTVHVTPIGEPRMLGTSRVQNGQFTVYGTPGEFFWVVYGTNAS
jgi:hypothetical protein